MNVNRLAQIDYLFRPAPHRVDSRAAGNSTYKKLAVQWLNQVQFSNQTFLVADSFVLRNRQLLVAANRS